MTWQQQKTKQVYKNRFMTVTEDEVVTDHGATLTFGIVHKEPAVYIIPWDGEKVTLVGQYRYAINSFSWEIPAGHMEHKNVEETAKVELREETGLSAEDNVEIGTFYVAPGHHTQMAHVFLATGLRKGSKSLEIAEQGMTTKEVTLAELDKMIMENEMKDGPTIASLKIFELYLKHKK